MSEFRTLFEITSLSNKINYTDKILSLGSCFSENIGAKLTYYKFPVIINPYGILYNPESIANSLEFLIENRKYTELDLFEHEGIWNSFYHHSRFSNSNKNDALTLINTSLQQAAAHLKSTRFLLITFGTAWVYKYKKTGKIVSNCHKIPEKEFVRYKLSINEIVERYTVLTNKLQGLNPELKIIYTVSPVRHLKDGADKNQLSKATLIMAVHELLENFGNASYFPSYEIMMDDLRDYRFYNDDMVHPSPLAVEYIWNKFSDATINIDSKKLMQEIHKINQAIEHRPFQPNSESHQKFLKSTLNRIAEIEKKHPTIKFEEEKKVLALKII